MRKKKILVCVMTIIFYALLFVVIVNADESGIEGIESVEELQEQEIDITNTPTPSPTPSPSPSPSPTPTITPTPALHTETLDYYENMQDGIDSINEHLRELEFGQFKLLISFWALVGLIAGMRVIKDTMG
jgi:hypothetical protein